MKKVRYTTYLSPAHLGALRGIEKEMDIPICSLVGYALDEYLLSIERLSRRQFAAVDKAALRDAVRARGAHEGRDLGSLGKPEAKGV